MSPVQSRPDVIPMDELPYTNDGRGATKDNVSCGELVGDVRATTAPELRLAVVEYDEGPDRGTIHPPELTGIKRMETWLSANMSAIVDLSNWC